MLCDQLPAGPMLVNTSMWIEGKYMDHGANNLNRKILPVGPLVQYPAAAPEGEEQHQNIDLIHWLAEEKEHSAVFASFGSEYFLPKEQIIEIAFRLELSDNVNFIWALMLPKGEENRVQLEQILPEAFLERVRDRGRVVLGWAPQALILGHSSIGGFISHCGWGSVLEAIEFGVPILAMPMNYEQPLNARLMVKMVQSWRSREMKATLMREDIAQVIKNVVIGNGGDPMRRKMKDLRENMKCGQEEDLDEVVKMLAQLSGKSADSDAIATARAKLV